MNLEIMTAAIFLHAFTGTVLRPGSVSTVPILPLQLRCKFSYNCSKLIALIDWEGALEVSIS